MDAVRIDKWLWAARFYKTRSLATEDIHKGRIQVNGVAVKPARELKVGDSVAIRQASLTRTIMVRSLSDKRGPAPQAQQLYAETEESLRLRAEAQELRRMGTEPALSLPHGRPTKQERRALNAAWDSRWSASIDP